MYRFLNPFLQLEAEKKDLNYGAARKYFGPSYFDPTLNILLQPQTGSGVKKSEVEAWA